MQTKLEASEHAKDGLPTQLGPSMLAEIAQAASWLTFLVVWAMAGRILTYRQ
jgi:hypothetical protein